MQNKNQTEGKNEWIQKLIYDKNFDINEQFSSDRLFENLKADAEDTDHLKPFEILIRIYEFSGAFGELSIAFT